MKPKVSVKKKRKNAIDRSNLDQWNSCLALESFEIDVGVGDILKDLNKVDAMHFW